MADAALQVGEGLRAEQRLEVVAGEDADEGESQLLRDEVDVFGGLFFGARAFEIAEVVAEELELAPDLDELCAVLAHALFEARDGFALVGEHLAVLGEGLGVLVEDFAVLSESLRVLIGALL